MQFLRSARYISVVVLVVFSFASNCRAQGSAKLDHYGGVTGVTCSRGRRPHFYTEKIGDRWWLCDPAGHGFFMKGAVGVSYAWPASETQIETKYGSAFNPYVISTAEDPADVWAFNYVINAVNRMRAWGFNWSADGAIGMIWPTNIDNRWSTPDHTIPDQFKMPFDFGSNTTRYAMLPQVYTSSGCATATPLKDMMNGIGPTYNAWHYAFGDYFDPNFNTCVGNMWNPKNNPYFATALGQSPGAPHGDYLAYIYLDEGDQTGFLDAGPDFPTVSNSGLPDNPISASAHPAWVALTAAPTQSSATVLGYATTYSDKEVYSKLQLANTLANEYACTGAGAPLACCTGNGTGACSVDPTSASYIGSANMTTAANSLNLAWGSHYTTLSTSDANCASGLAACLQGGSYASWGTGTGLLDENGTCPTADGGGCWVGDDITLQGETAAMQADMSAFLTDYLDQYFSVLTGWIHAYAPGVLTQMTMGGASAPPRKEVLESAAKYLDLPQLQVPPANCPTCTDIQQRIDFVTQYLGDKPWMEWEGFFANPDSAESAHVRTDNMATTQAGRGTAYQQMVANLVNAKDSGGSYHVVGFYWWAMYDMNGEGLNWGLCTPSDNPYDGASATISGINGSHGKDQWGYRTGGERTNYGDFLSAVEAANTNFNSLIMSVQQQARRGEGQSRLLKQPKQAPTSNGKSSD